MNEQEFKPYQPEKKVPVVITKREAVLLQKLRRYPFGQFVIHKMNNVLIRVEIRDSQLIDETTDIDLG